MVSITVRLNTKDSISGLDNIQNRAIPEGIRAGLDAIAGDVVIAAKEIVPVRTGALRDSIRVLQKTENSVTIGSDLEYAAAVEYGTSSRPAQPYIGPQKDRVDAEGGKTLSDEIFRRIKR